GFQIGFSERFLRQKQTWRAFARAQRIKITANLINGRNIADTPIQGGGNPADQVKIYAADSDRAIFGDPLFTNPAAHDFTLRRNSPAAKRPPVGAYAPGSSTEYWWTQNFPPDLIDVRP